MFDRRTKTIALCLLLGACGGEKPLYTWGNYPRALLSYSKNPEQGPKFTASLEETLRRAEAKRNVPPGLYAEYGYMLLDQGKAPEAIENFQKERGRWPESAFLMNKIISRLTTPKTSSEGEASKPAEAATPAKPAEATDPSPSATGASSSANLSSTPSSEKN